jgi:hypothetical protein
MSLVGIVLPTAANAFRTINNDIGVLSQIKVLNGCQKPAVGIFNGALPSADSRSATSLKLNCFMESEDGSEQESLSTTEQRIFGLNSGEYLSQAKSTAIINGLTVGPFGAFSLNADFRDCLDKAILQFDEKKHNLPRVQNKNYHHFKQFHFDSMPIGVVQGSTFAPVDEVEQNKLQEVITGEDLGRAMAKYLSLATTRTWQFQLMALYCIERGTTTFDAHVDLLQIHGTYSPLDTDQPQPTTPFMNKACLAKSQTDNKESFLQYMRKDPARATETLRKHGTYLPLGEVCVFAGRDYPEGDHLGMPHSGPSASNHPRRFLGFHFTEVYPEGIF